MRLTNFQYFQYCINQLSVLIFVKYFCVVLTELYLYLNIVASWELQVNMVPQTQGERLLQIFNNY